MTRFDRREFLALTSTVLLPQASAQDAPARTPPKAAPPRLPESWTNAATISVWPDAPPGPASFVPQPIPADWPPVFIRNVSRPDLHVFRPARSNGHALLVVPGGSYWFVSVANEGAEVAERMTALGFTIFVLTYRLPGEGWAARADVPLQDAQRAMRVIRSRATHFGFDAENVSVVGFSAGGHLAATLTTGHAERVYAGIDALDRLSARPFAAALVYPVITLMKPWTHERSRKQLLGDTPSDAEVERRCPDLHVDALTPPVFIVHAMDDADVPVENSLRMMNALRMHDRPVEAHLLQEGGHAFGTGRPHTPSERWPDLLGAWLKRLESRQRA
jgi:acetyl esterase/lipase